MTDSQKLRVLRQIQSALSRTEHPTLRACGLTEAEAQVVASEGLVRLFSVAVDGPLLDRYRVETIDEAGHGVLSQSDVTDSLRVTVEPPRRSVWSRIASALGTKLWDVVKVALGAVVGWLLKTYFG